MKNTAITEQIEASKRFNPYSLKDFLARTEGGEVIVDRTRLLKTQDDVRLFYIILNKDYRQALKYFRDNNIKFDLILVDPPYDYVICNVKRRFK